MLFPHAKLAERFGADDADYAVQVFLHHYKQLVDAGFDSADTILEIGPGRNLGTAVLMWAVNQSLSEADVAMLLWDVFPNMAVDAVALQHAATMLLRSKMFNEVVSAVANPRFERTLEKVADGNALPNIQYDVRPLQELLRTRGSGIYELVYSHAAVEHVWKISDFWRMIITLTKAAGWHSHRVDLADHGDRSGNYLELLEWSSFSYWITMRFVPGAVNRWRASMHIAAVESAGLEIVSLRRELRPELPRPLTRLHSNFRQLPLDELKTTTLDFVARKL